MFFVMIHTAAVYSKAKNYYRHVVTGMSYRTLARLGVQEGCTVCFFFPDILCVCVCAHSGHLFRQ